MDLARLLETLKAAGVRRATLDPSGALVRVEFFDVTPSGSTEATAKELIDPEPEIPPEFAVAFRTLQGPKRKAG